MAVCQTCRKEMTDSVSCNLKTLVLLDGSYDRLEHRPSRGAPFRDCGDCGTSEGGLHHPGCDMEDCPRCRGQLIMCGCWEDLEGGEGVATAL